MPGNEVGDRVHNFFAQDNLSQGQHHSQHVDGSWPVGNNLWAGSQTLPSTNSKNYYLQQSDIERGHSSHSFSVPYGLNFTQPTLNPELAKSKPQSQQPNVNGYIHGRQILQPRQNGSSFLGMDTESDRHNIQSRGLSIYGSQPGNFPENHTTSVRSESSESPVSFDFFGSKQQMSGQQTGMLQSLPQQHSGFSDMHLLQQQVMLRKMQELQRQRQIQQLEAIQQSSLNQIPSITKQASGSHSPALIDDTPISPITEAANYPWATEPTAGNTNWLQHATPAIQGSSNGFRFPNEQGLALNLMGLVPQQVDQSLYGVPISNTRGTPHQYSHVPPDKPPMQQMTMYSNSFPGNQFTGFPDQVNMQDGSLVSRQGFHGEHLFGHDSGQGLHGGMNLENLQQVNSLQRNAPLQEFHERQELAGPPETLREKTVMQVSSSQDADALDPTEEKILFGDDNIWDAFGSDANMGAGGFNMLNGTGVSNGLPSVQSGSWTALMQSAVAETTNNDIGLQKGWSGLSSQNTEVAQGSRQPSKYEENTKQQTVLADNNFHIASALSSESVPPSHNANIINSYKGVPAFQQPGQKFSYEHGERLQIDSTHRSIQQSSEEGSKWLSRGPLQKPLADRSQNYGNASHSLDAEMNAKNMLGSWAHQQKVPPYNSGQPQSKFDDRKFDDRKFDETVTPSGDAVSKMHGNEIKLQNSHSSDHKRMMYEEMSHGGHKWKADSGPNSTIGFEHVKSPMGNPQVNREDPSLNKLSGNLNSSTGRTCQETSRPLPNSHHPNYWKHADSSMENKGSEDPGKFQHYLNKAPQFLESSMNSSDKDAVKTHGTENCERKENSSDSHSSNISQHTTAGGTGESVRSDGSDSRNLPGGKQKLSGKTGRRTTGPRKFQYHPLGNLDEDVQPSYGMEHATHSQVISQHIPRASYSHNQGYFGQSKNLSQFPKASSEMEKDLQGNRKEVDDLPSRGILPGFAPDISAPFDGSISIYEPNKAAQSSQNMLELLHKVDQTRERGNFDGSVGPLQQNQSSAPQGFSLQLAPPSQRLPLQNHLEASQSSAQTVGSLSSFHETPEMREKGRTWLVSTAQVQSFPSSLETSQEEFNFSRIGMPGQTGNEASQPGIRGNFPSALTSGFPHSRKQVQNQQFIDASGKVMTNQPMNIFFNRHDSGSQQTDDCASVALTGQSTPASLLDTAGITPHDNSSGDTSQHCSREGVSASKVSAVQAVISSQPSISSGISKEDSLQKMVPSAWSNVPGRQHLFGAQPHKFPPSIFQPSQSNNNVLPTSSTPQVQEDQNARKGGSGPSEFGVNSMDSQGFVCGERQPAKESPCQLVSSGNTELAEMMTASQGKEYIVKSTSDASPSNSASTQRDMEAFGRSLKPNSLLHQNYSLLHQIQAMKSTEIDPSSNVSLKRLKRADSGLGCQIAPEAGKSIEYNATVEDLVVHRGAVPSGDSKMLSFLEPADNWDKNAPSQDVFAFGQKDPENHSRTNSTASGRVEHSQISPQMAPSWFNQFGTFKNGQMLPKNGSVQAVEQLFTFGKSSDKMRAHNSPELVNAAAHSFNQVCNNWQRSTPASLAIEHFSSTQSPAQDVTDQSLVVERPKKRKSATSELLPWHKELTQSSQTLLTISLAEVLWSKAANRVIDKVHTEGEMIEDGQPVIRPKRRLILTTQLMQQLFRPPLAAVLSADASSNYETVAYLVARLALGDACSLIPCSGSDYGVPLDHSNFLSDKCKTTERIGDQHCSKVGEDFIGTVCGFSDKRKPSGRIVDQHLSEVVEDFIGRTRKLENDFMRLDKRTAVLDLRIENQDVEKVSVINRFAKFHGRGQADGAETSSSSDAASNAQRPFPQRYVTAFPVPRNLPDRVQCLSL